MTADAADHPVLDLLRRRAQGGSRPGARGDPHRLALVVEGGGMRGVVSAAMTAGIERLGLTNAFDLVAGASAGSLNGAALLAGVAQGCAASYHGAFASREFIDPRRLVLGRPAIDVAFALAHDGDGLDAERHERTVTSPIDLICVATDVETAEPVELTGMRSREELWSALLASSRIPYVGGPPVEHHGRRYLDGGLTEAIPVRAAQRAGATHLLVLQTRPVGVARTSGSRLADRLIERTLRRLNPDLVRRYRERAEDYERTIAEIAERAREPDRGAPYVLALRPPAGTPSVSQLERDPIPLAAAARAAQAQAEALLDGGGG